MDVTADELMQPERIQREGTKIDRLRRPQPPGRSGNGSYNRLPDLRAVLEAIVAEVPVAELPALIGLLEAAKVQATMRALSPAPATTDVVDVATLAAELAVAESWLRAQARTGKLPHVRAGKHIRFRRSEVLGVLEHRIASPAAAEKRSNGADPLPACYQSEPANDPKNQGANGAD